MLKFLTHKLRTHSLNEENVSEKVGVGTAQPALRREGHTATRKWPPRSREQRSGTIAGFHTARLALVRSKFTTILYLINFGTDRRKKLWLLGTKSVENRRSGGGVRDGRPSD